MPDLCADYDINGNAASSLALTKWWIHYFYERYICGNLKALTAGEGGEEKNENKVGGGVEGGEAAGRTAAEEELSDADFEDIIVLLAVLALTIVLCVRCIL